jgi:mono/diheme cytochrome c family protein
MKTSMGRAWSRGRKSGLIAAAGIAATLGVGVPLSTNAQPALEAHYTMEQAQRGWQTFFNNCAGCHGREVPIRFMTYPDARSFFTFISENMPYDGGTRLPATDYVDITALVMNWVGFPAGDTELLPDPAVLATIIPQAAPGPAEVFTPGPIDVAAADAGAVVSYNEAQAQEGMRSFTLSCGGCHAGTAMVGVFATNYADAGAFYNRISATMPADAPASLPPQVYANIVAYMMQLNGFTAGGEALAPDPAALSAIIPLPMPAGGP